MRHPWRPADTMGRELTRRRFCLIPPAMPLKASELTDRCWRKSRIAARILVREDEGRLTARDVRIGRRLAQDPGVTPRLIDQALYAFSQRPYRVAVARRSKTG